MTMCLRTRQTMVVKNVLKLVDVGLKYILCEQLACCAFCVYIRLIILMACKDSLGFTCLKINRLVDVPGTIITWEQLKLDNSVTVLMLLKNCEPIF